MAEQIKVMTESNGQEMAEEVKKYVGAQVAGSFDAVEYNKSSKKIIFKHGETQKGEIDATDFIKDGMVENVELTEGSDDNDGKQVLKITFNTEAGKDDIEIPVEGIFNAANYMTKEEVNTELGKKANTADVVSKEEYEEDKDTFFTDSDIEPVASATIQGWFK